MAFTPSWISCLFSEANAQELSGRRFVSTIRSGPYCLGVGQKMNEKISIGNNTNAVSKVYVAAVNILWVSVPATTNPDMSVVIISTTIRANSSSFAIPERWISFWYLAHLSKTNGSTTGLGCCSGNL